MSSSKEKSAQDVATRAPSTCYTSVKKTSIEWDFLSKYASSPALGSTDSQSMASAAEKEASETNQSESRRKDPIDRLTNEEWHRVREWLVDCVTMKTASTLGAQGPATHGDVYPYNRASGLQCHPNWQSAMSEIRSNLDSKRSFMEETVHAKTQREGEQACVFSNCQAHVQMDGLRATVSCSWWPSTEPTSLQAFDRPAYSTEPTSEQAFDWPANPTYIGEPGVIKDIVLDASAGSSGAH